MPPFQTVSTLQSLRSSAASTRQSVVPVPDATEERYWSEKFGLGKSHTKRKKYAFARSATLKAGTSSIVHQIIISPSYVHSSHKYPLVAVLCGPRVPLYGMAGAQSSLYQKLKQQQQPKQTGDDITDHADEDDDDHAAKNKADPDRQISTGGQLALTASIRPGDGRILAIGRNDGTIQMSDTTSRATIATLGGNKNNKKQQQLAIRSIHWFRSGQSILATGDDGVMRIWKFQQHERPWWECRTGHGDAVRCADLWQPPTQTGKNKNNNKKATDLASSPLPKCLAATGSYDHTIRLWNLENIEESTNDHPDSNQQEDRCLAVLSQGAPVETLQWVRSSHAEIPVWLVSAGGHTLKVWNPLSGTCVCTVQAKHRKTITSMLLIPRRRGADRVGVGEDSSKNMAFEIRLVTGSLDGLLRIHQWDSESGEVKFLHGVDVGAKTNTAITALAATRDGTMLMIGTASGTVWVRQQGPSSRQYKRLQDPPAGTYAFFMRGMNADPIAGDHVVQQHQQSNKKRKLSEHDLALQQFRHADALDEALATRSPPTVVAVLEELGKRRGLAVALSNRDEESLEPLLAFTVRYINRPSYASLLTGVANKLLEIYGDVAGQSETIDELFVKLKTAVSDECRTQRLLYRIVGQLDHIMTTKKQVEE